MSMSYLISRVLAKPRLILDEMCRLYGKFASYLRRVLCKRRLIFPRINGANIFFGSTRVDVTSLSHCDSRDGRSCLVRLVSLSSCRAPNDNFRKNICSGDDLRSRIFEIFVVKFLACLPLLGFSNI